jgi:hypothetical protein
VVRRSRVRRQRLGASPDRGLGADRRHVGVAIGGPIGWPVMLDELEAYVSAR